MKIIVNVETIRQLVADYLNEKKAIVVKPQDGKLEYAGGYGDDAEFAGISWEVPA